MVFPAFYHVFCIKHMVKWLVNNLFFILDRDKLKVNLVYILVHTTIVV